MVHLNRLYGVFFLIFRQGHITIFCIVANEFFNLVIRQLVFFKLFIKKQSKQQIFYEKSLSM
jgi:hypothetical protein